MAGGIKGLTVEIGGDTTKLGRALDDVSKRSRSLSTELGQINKLLKLDPGNTDLLAQKHKVLSEAIASTKEKLDTLKEAERQVQEQFERGEVSEEQYRALQREVIATEQKLGQYEGALEDTERAMQGLDDSTQKTTDNTGRFGEALKKAGQVAGAALAAAGAAAVALGTKVVNAYADYEQLAGGIDKLFGKDSPAAQTVKNFADEAFRTAGLSANEYMETVTSFSAALITSLGGDTERAARYADMAITDMADNANTFGSDIASLQNAYAGFAKGQFNMLDNLRLGFSGTKEGMQELLDAAEQISGVHYDIDSYADIVAAIHEVQESMSIAGATAAEAEGTISGSLSMLSGSIENLMIGLGNADADVGKLMSDVVTSFDTVVNNITPVIENVVSALPQVITSLAGALETMLPTIMSSANNLLNQVLALIVAELPRIFSVILDAAIEVAGMIVDQAPAILDAVLTVIEQLITTIAEKGPELIEQIVALIPVLITTLLSHIPELIQAAITLLMAIVQAIPTIVKELASSLPMIIDAIVAALIDGIPLLIQGSIQLFMAILEAIPEIVVALAEALPEILAAIIRGLEGLAEMLWNDVMLPALNTMLRWGSEMVDKGKQAAANFLTNVVNFFTQLPGKIAQFLSDVINRVIQWAKDMPAKAKQAASDTFNAVVNGLAGLPGQMLNIGKNIVQGLWNGISGMVSWMKSKVTGFANTVLGGIRAAFDIHSPSKKMAWIGQMLDEGLAQGIEDHAKEPLDALQELSSDMLGTADTLNGISMNRTLDASFGTSGAQDGGLMGKLDRILNAIEAGKVIALDGRALVGATVDRYDDALGQTRILAERGAV